MLLNNSSTDYCNAYRLARQQKLISEVDTSIIFVDLDILKNRLEHLRSIFPPNTLHAIPIKTHPLLRTLRFINELGFGLEAASFEELSMGKAAGVPSERLVFDSPVKTRLEIEQCNQHFKGCIINVNDLSELHLFPDCVNLRVGLRINPLVSTSDQAIFDVSSKHSKFGEPISNRNKILQAFLNFPFLEGLHVHTGSDIPEIEDNAPIIKQIYELAQEINTIRAEKKVGGPLRFIDIGGGATTPTDGSPITGLNDYKNSIDQLVPELFDHFQVITEMGRFTFAHCAWLVSDIAQIRSFSSDKSTILVHAGADLFVREVYAEHAPTHRIFIFDEKSEIKNSNESYTYDIGGPLCFAGDYLIRNIELPKVTEDDKIIIADIGANTMSLWSRHCSRSFPKVIYYSSVQNRILDIKAREHPEDLINFWS